MPNCLVLCGHPMEQSFSAAVADRYAAALTVADIEVRPVGTLANARACFHPIQAARDDDVRGDVAAFWEDLLWANHFVIVHLLWVGRVPGQA